MDSFSQQAIATGVTKEGPASCKEVGLPVSEENLSARPMCPGGHICLGNFVLPDRIYCPFLDNMSGASRITCPPGKCVRA